MRDESRPLIIGGSGGSGTRLFARLCILSGFHLGANLNPSLDSLDFFHFYERWINKYLLRRQVPLGEKENDQMKEEFKMCTNKHRSPIPGLKRRWGFKNPRSMLLLPFLNEHFKDMKFVHVVRDGRDMAYSTNQRQVHKHAEALLGRHYNELNRLSLSILFWAKSNMEVAEYGEDVMRDRYIRIRFEDLCKKPEPTLIRLLNFLEVKFDGISVFTREIKSPSSIGRWLSKPKKEQVELTEVARPALRHFGYL